MMYIYIYIYIYNGFKFKNGYNSGYKKIAR